MHTAAQGEPGRQQRARPFYCGLFDRRRHMRKRYNLEVKNIPTAKVPDRPVALLPLTQSDRILMPLLRRGREWMGKILCHARQTEKSSASTRLRVIKQSRQCSTYGTSLSAMTMKKPWRRPITSARMMLEFEFLGFEMPTDEKIGAP